MLIQALDTTADFTVKLLIQYSFDLGGYTASELIERWLNNYPAMWIRLAVIEALYQGRYKAISVEQILAFWYRRGQAVHHFNNEFERLICGNLVIFNNGHNHPTVVTVEADAGKKTPVQLVDATKDAGDKDAHATTNLSSEKAARYHQASHKDQSLLKSDNRCPIEQFTPDEVNGSDFYSKLKAISQSESKALAEGEAERYA